MLARDHSSTNLGMRVLSAEDGHAAVTLVVDPSWVNGHGLAHGGLVFSLADTAFACAANSRVAGTVTSGAEIVYYSPAHEGDTLVAEGVVRHVAGRHSLVDVTVRRGSTVLAEYRGRGAVARDTAPRPRSTTTDIHRGE
jgi:acyl-CoA thioesterase